MQLYFTMIFGVGKRFFGRSCFVLFDMFLYRLDEGIELSWSVFAGLSFRSFEGF
jgi:hypothetical protein